MFPRLLALCLCLASSSAFATVLVQHGDSYDVLEVFDDELLMTGGSVNQLVLGGLTEGAIEGGVIGENNESEAAIVMTADDHLTIRGGTIRRASTFPNRSGLIHSQEGAPVLTLEGTYFRMYDVGFNEANHWRIEGWLADGNFLNVTFIHGLLAANVTIEFNFVPGEVPLSPGDTNYDDVVDLEDLNNVRNNFDGSALGDSNGDGFVDLEDLNLVRNNFGSVGYFHLGPEYEVPRPQSVPEPESCILMVIATAAGLRIACKGRCS